MPPALVGPGVGKIGIDGESLIVGRQRLVVALEFAQSIALAISSPGVVWLER